MPTANGNEGVVAVWAHGEVLVAPNTITFTTPDPTRYKAPLSMTTGTLPPTEYSGYKYYGKDLTPIGKLPSPGYKDGGPDYWKTLRSLKAGVIKSKVLPQRSTDSYEATSYNIEV